MRKQGDSSIWTIILLLLVLLVVAAVCDSGNKEVPKEPQYEEQQKSFEKNGTPRDIYII